MMAIIEAMIEEVVVTVATMIEVVIIDAMTDVTERIKST